MQNRDGRNDGGQGAHCAREEEAAPYVCGEFSERAGRQYQEHLAACAACARRVADFRATVRALRECDAPVECRDLSDAVLGRVRDPRPANRLGRRIALVTQVPRALRWAAGFALAAGLGWTAFRGLSPWAARTVAPPPADLAASRTRAVHDALAWFSANQSDTGAWDPARWGGKREYAMSLTGMALLALLSQAEALTGPAQRAAVERGLGFVVGQQAGDGRFGPSGDCAMYNHGIATLALVRGYAATGDNRLKGPIDRALRFIRSQQMPSGGWGYRDTAPEAPNTSISVWQLNALLLAQEAGWPDDEHHLKRGLRWLSGMVDGGGLFGYRGPDDTSGSRVSLTAMGASCMLDPAVLRMADQTIIERVRRALPDVASRDEGCSDFYRDYFLARALRADGTRQCASLLVERQRALLARRSGSGPNAGSWDTVDRWSAVGGRIYTTAMAAMSLQ
jgi:hypothetical protein